MEHYLQQLASYFAQTSVLHITHWQHGILEDLHPDWQPIWWANYGTESDFLSLINNMKQSGFISMPFTNWTCLEQARSGDRVLPTLANTPTLRVK